MADVSFPRAAALYADALSRAASPTQGAGGVASRQSAPAHDSFAELVGKALEAARGTGLKAEQQAMAAIKGQTSLHEVVAAVSNAEIALQTVVSVRDRVVSAYQEIMRMPI